MKEPKAVHAFDVYEAYTKTGDDDAAQVYLKSEADRYIAYLKYKRCLAMAEKYNALAKACEWTNHEYSSRLYSKRCMKLLSLADKFKEAMK